MQTLSALDAISPAVVRTKLVLFTPFRKGRTWKLSATAYLTKAGTVFVPFPLFLLLMLPFARATIGNLGVALAVAGVAVVTLLYAWLFHVFTRLQFAYFDIVLNREEFVAPVWAKYRQQARPLSALKIAIGTVWTLAMAVPLVAYVRHLIPLMESMRPGQDPPLEFMAAFFAGYGIVLLGFGSLFIVSTLLSDFLVPPMALESVTLGEALRRLAEFIRNSPGQFAAYIVVKFLAAFVAYMGVVIAMEIVIVVTGAILALVAGLIGFLLHLAGVPTVVLIVLAVPLVVAYYIFIFYGMTLAIGSVLTWMEAYTLYFLGGRHALIGAALEASTPVPAVPAGYSPLPPQVEGEV